MERRDYEQTRLAEPDPTLRLSPTADELARRQEVWEELMELRETAPKTDKPIVEIIREMRDAWERGDA